MNPDRNLPVFSVVLAILLLVAVQGCTEHTPGPATPVICILYGSEKGDLSFTDSASEGLAAALRNMTLTVREIVPGDQGMLPRILNTTNGTDAPDLVITVGYQYSGLTRHLAEQHPAIHFLGIDQAGSGPENLREYEITSYGSSYLAGVLAASATKTGKLGIILGTQSDILDAFLQGFSDGAHAVNASIAVDHAYVRPDSVEGFSDPAGAGRIAEGMYRNGTDVIYTAAGLSGTGAIRTAEAGTGRYIIGVDSDQSGLGPSVVLASAVKRTDSAVYSGIADQVNGTFIGGITVAGLKDGATGLIFNPEFSSYRGTVSAFETRAEEEEAQYLASRTGSGR